MSQARRSVTGLVLAGGQARRMGGADKGLLTLGGRPMVSLVLETLQPQVDALLVNANRHLEAYSALAEPYGAAVVSDALADFQGPLAGLASGLAACRSDDLLCVPCDSPLLPGDLAARLGAARAAAGADIAVAFCARLQPVFALLPRRLLPSLEAYLATGERKIDRWYHQHTVATADFSEQPELFLNVNTPADRTDLEARLRAAGRCP